MELLDVGTPEHMVLVVKILEVLLKQMPRHIVEVINHDNYIYDCLYNKLKMLKTSVFTEQQ